MAQTITLIEDILKYKYQPALANQIGIDPSPFLEKIRKTPATNNTIVAAAPIGVNGGFGFGAEGVGTPSAGSQRYEKFSLDMVDMYVDIQISNKTVQLGSSNQASMINALDQEIMGSYASAKWNIGRSLFGDGTGKLCALTSADTNGSSTSTIEVDDCSKLVEGLTVDIYTYATDAATDGTLAAANKGLRILGIDRENKVITVNSASLAVTVAKVGDDAPTAAGTYGFITVQNSYKRELCGLGAIFDSAITTLYGLTKASHTWLAPTVVNASNDITDLVLYEGVKKAKDYKGSEIDMILMGDAAFSAYQTYMRENNIVLADKQRFEGGAVGYNVIVGSQNVTVVNEKFVPTNEAYGVNTRDFYLEQTPWDFVSKDGGIFSLMEGTSIYRALLASYGNLMCVKPGGCVRFTNCNAA